MNYDARNHELQKSKTEIVTSVNTKEEHKIRPDIRRGRRRRQLLDDFKEMRGYSHLKEEALVRSLGRARFGGGFGPVVRQTAK